MCCIIASCHLLPSPRPETRLSLPEMMSPYSQSALATILSSLGGISMLHFPFLQTPVSMMLPVPPSQVWPSVLTPEAAAAFLAVNPQSGEDLFHRVTSLPFELPLSSLAALPPPPPRGMARACPANMAVMIQVKVENCILTCFDVL